MRKLLLLFFCIATTLSCKDKLELFEEYNDTSQVFGILKTSENRNYIKITKAFSGVGNTYDMAKIPDSSNYTRKLNAKLIEISNGAKKEFPLDTLTLRHRKPGVFYSPNQLVYYTDEKIKDDAKYQLIIDKGNNNIVRSEIEMSLPPKVSNKGSIKLDFIDKNTYNITIEPRSKTPLIEVWLKFNYVEINTVKKDTVDKSFKWKMAYKVYPNVKINYLYKITSRADGFFKHLKENVKPDKDIIRYIGFKKLLQQKYNTYKGRCMDIQVYAGDENLYLYSASNNDKVSLIQTSKCFSNIENGVGIFGGVTTNSILVDIDTKSELKIRTDYKELNFQNPN
ncbi:MAG: DUF4249 family protein [Bacteroidales bacterium]